MKRTAALLIVLTFTGSPVMHAACLAWCTSGTVALSTPCHDPLVHPMPVAMSEDANTCSAVLTSSTFFTVERRETVHPPLVAALAPEQGALVTGSLPVHRGTVTSLTIVRAGPAQVLRL